MSCSLIGNHEFINDLDALVDSLKDRYDSEDIKRGFKIGINKLRKKFSDFNSSDFNETIEEYLDDEMGMYKFGELVDDGFTHLESIKDVNLEEELIEAEQERESKVDSLSPLSEQRKTLKNQFLNKYFVLNSRGKLFFINDFKNSFAKSLFINEAEQSLITNNEEMNQLIEFYRGLLKSKIIEALKLINPRMVEQFLGFVSTESALNFIQNEFESFDSSLLYKIPLISYQGALKPEEVVKLEGWKAYVALRNFDSMVRLVFSDAVNINNINQYDDVENKYSLNLGNNNTTTWRDDSKDVDETEELGSLTTLFIETMKVYKNGKPTNLNMTFADTKTAIGRLMQSFDLLYEKAFVTPFDDGLISVLKEEFKEFYGVRQIEDIIDKYLRGKNFKQLLAASKEHPSELNPILFRLMTPVIQVKYNVRNNINPLGTKFPQKGTKAEETLQSLYHNVFDLNNETSIINLYRNSGLDANLNSIYNFINALFLNIENKSMLEYKQDSDGIVIESLSLKSANARLNSITRALDGKFHKYNVLGTYEDANTTKFNTFELREDPNVDKSITIGVGQYDIVVNSNPKAKDGGVTIFLNGNKIEKDTLNIEEFLPFISEVLDIPLMLVNQFNSNTIDKRIYQNYKTLGGRDLELINLASHILYNYRVGKHMLNTTRSTYEEDAKKYYELAVPKPMYNQFQPSLIPTSDYNTIKTLSYAKDIVDGYAEINTVKDGAGKLISTLALSSLMSKVGEIWENHTKSENSPAKDFSIYSMYEGVEFMRDFQGSGENKQSTEFSQAELAIASFIYDMYGDMEEVTEEDGITKHSNKKDGILRVMGPIIADKSNLPKLKFKWDSPLSKYGETLTLRTATILDLKNIIFKEFGEYYNQVFQNIQNQYNILNNYVSRAAVNLGLVGNVKFDYRTNFKKANEVFGNRVVDVLHEAIYLAQLDGHDIELVDLVGYINNKGKLENNPSLIHQLKLYGKADNSFITSINTDETYENFWKRKEIQLVTDFLLSGTILKVQDGQTPRKGAAIATAIKYNKDFLHKENIAVVSITDGDKKIKISKLSDFENWFPYRQWVREQENLSPLHDIHSPQFSIDSTLEAMGTETKYEYTINPEIIRHNLLDFFLSEEFVMSTTGTYVSHPAKNNSIILRESTQFGLAVKRYVSYTASKHREASGFLNGIPNKLNIAVIEDYYDSGLNYSGNYDTGNIKPFDGASFYNPTMRYLDNNSLGGDAMGVDKKPFGHHMGEKSGIGFIFKTAGFALTNDRIRNASSITPDGKAFNYYENLNKQMLNIPWHALLDWTKDYNGNNIDYGDKWYVYHDGRWFMRFNPRVEENENNELITYYSEAQVFPNGEINNVIPIKNDIEYGVIDTNWKLWNLFGGAYSGHIQDGELTYKQDNTSVEMLVKAMNNVGIKKEGYNNVLGQEGVDQVLKKAQIHIAATGGAIKYGGANINSKAAYFNPDYHMTYMTIDAYDFGEQLDAEHHAEDGNVSLMTLVVNALGARGYSRELAAECYSALEAIGEEVCKDGLKGLEEFNTTNDDSLLKNALSQIIYKTLSKVSDGDGNMLNALAATLLEYGDKKFDWSNIKGKFPISHPAIFLKMISSIASELEKGIRLKFEGNMLVLNPSNRIFGIINGKLAGQYKDNIAALENIENLNRANPIKAHEIKVGHNYRSLINQDLIIVDNPDDVNTIMTRMLGGEFFYETVIETDEEGNKKPLGHDLAPYNAMFADAEGNYYNMWLLASTWSLWENRDNSNESIKTELRRQLQKDLNALSEGVESTVEVRLYNPNTGTYENKIVKVDKSKTKVSPFEIVLPRMYKKAFGLQVDDDLNVIRNDLKFFLRRSLANWKSKIKDNGTWDLELKTLDGNHIYLGRNPLIINSDLKKVNLETEIDGDTLYRITPEGRRLYSLPYHVDGDGKFIADVQIYKDSNNQEIIYSNNLTHFLDNFSYNSVVFSEKTQSDKRALLEALYWSNNKSALRKIDLITRIVNQRNNNKLNKELEKSSKLFENLLSNSEFMNPFDEDIDLTFKEILEDENSLQQAINFISNDYTYAENQRNKVLLRIDLDDVNTLMKENPFFRGMILSGIDIHTSFLQSIEMIVSRTPAQSQQSFMTMRLAAFAMENTNSAYVSRMLFLLQGSDLDIDKISLLGLAFNRGKFVVWSPYISLNSEEEFEATKRISFPTGKELKWLREDEIPTKRPYDVLKNDLSVTKDGEQTTITTQNGNSLLLTKVDENTYTLEASGNYEEFPPLEKYILIRNALSKIESGKEIRSNFRINEGLGVAEQGIDNGNHIYTHEGEYDYLADYTEFNHTILPYNTNEYDEQELAITPKTKNLSKYAEALDTAIRVYNKLGVIYDYDLAKMINNHNTYLKGRNKIKAALNFISIRTKDISKSPINLILALASIDEQMGNLEALLSEPEFQRLVSQTWKTDRGSVYSKFFLLTLTLAGKENVGIVASALKNFEAISQYTYQTLEEGSEEDLKDLCFNRVINGHRVNMIANAYTRNTDTIKSEDVLEALKTVNNDEDAFLVMSGLLSAATDNTKNPILPKLNAGPEMLSLYNSGVMLGLSVREIAKLVLSDTGILLSNLSKGNVFNGKLNSQRLTSTIRYFQRPPSVNFTAAQYDAMTPIFKHLGLLSIGDSLTKTKLDEIVGNRYNRITVNKILRFLASPNGESSVLKSDKNLFVYTQIGQLKNSKEYRGFSKRRLEIYKELSEKNKNDLTENEKNLLNRYEEYKNDREIVEAQINELLDFLKNDEAILSGDLRTAYDAYMLTDDAETTTNIKALKGLLFNGSSFVSNINEIIDWIHNKEIVEGDLIEGVDGRKHLILNQIARLDEFSQEMSALRTFMALNQGLENKLVDQLNFDSTIGNAIKNRLDTIGKNNLERFYDVQNLLNQLAEFNTKLRELGKLDNTEEYYVDLNTFVSNPEYNKLVKDIYGKIKFAVNIFKVADGVSHYRTYLRIANLSMLMGKLASVVYRTTKLIEDTVMPTMNARKSKHKESIRKNIIPIIYRTLNSEFIRSRNQSYIIPSFEVENGKVKESLEGATYKLDLNSEEAYLKFKEWIQYVEFPKWKLQYPDNKFIQSLGYRIYDFNFDHNLTVNLAKILSFNMKNPSDLVAFDLAKADLLKLPSRIIDLIFYYNLIAYNNQAGQLSMTDMFEDLVAANNFELIRDYNTFISNHEDLDISLANTEKLKQEIAPVISAFEVKPSLNIPYIYVKNRKDGKTYLLYKSAGEDASYNEFDEDIFNDMFGEEEFSTNKKDFLSIMGESNYYKLGYQESDGNLKRVIEAGSYILTPASKLADIEVSFNNNTYTANDILKKGKEKGYTKLSEIFPSTGKGDNRKYDAKMIENILDVIFDNTNC